MGIGMGGAEFASFDAIPDAVIIVGRNRSIVHANRHAEFVVGYEGGKLVGIWIEALIPERYRRRQGPR